MEIIIIEPAMIGIAIKKSRARRELILKAIKVPAMSITGERTHMWIIMRNTFWVIVTSVVSLVTRDAVLNLSIFANEKSWMRLKRRFRRL